MSMRLPPGIQCGSQFPTSLFARANAALGKVNSDSGANVQILLSYNYDGGVTGEVLYYDGGDDVTYVATFVNGVAVSVVALASRPDLGIWYLFFLEILGQGAADQRAGFINVLTGVAVTNTCQALTSAQKATNNNQSLGSVTSQIAADFDWWRLYQAGKTNAQWLEEGGTSKSRYSAYADFILPDGTTVTDQSGNGNTWTSQGGANSTGDTYVYQRKSFTPRVPASTQRAAFR
jgi:hypothetical protein